MRVITLEKCKELLGITDTSQDPQITAKIPYVDAKVKQITRNRYNYQIFGNTKSGSPYVEIYSIITSRGVRYNFGLNVRRDTKYVSGIMNTYWLDDIEEYIEIGQLIEGDGIPADSYIEDMVYNGDIFEDGSGNQFSTPVIKLSANATATESNVRMFTGINIGLQDVIAKGIQYLINKTSTTVPGRTVTSVGTVSYDSVDGKMDGKYGMPAWFVKAFPKYARGH